VNEGNSNPIDTVRAAQEISAAVEAMGCEYALGGAIALGFWAEPRGTLDVDLTLFLPSNEPSGTVRMLQTIGCEFRTDRVIASLREHGFCQVMYQGRRIDVFVPTIEFYETARQRRKRVLLDERPIFIWDPETLCVFKLMFFRRKDLADLEQILRVQGNQLDHSWVGRQIIQIYGERDPRVSQWQELVNELLPGVET
jgi:hypothetical protein